MPLIDFNWRLHHFPTFFFFFHFAFWSDVQDSTSILLIQRSIVSILPVGSELREESRSRHVVLVLLITAAYIRSIHLRHPLHVVPKEVGILRLNLMLIIFYDIVCILGFLEMGKSTCSADTIRIVLLAFKK